MIELRVRVMVLNTTFNNIPVISWGSALLGDGTGVPGEITDMRKSLTNFIT